MRWLLFIPLVLTLMPISAQDALISARLDRTVVYEGDSVVLHIEAGDLDAEVQPDYLPLMEAFNIRDTSRSARVTFVNGRRKMHSEWTVLLEPKRSGSLTIPALQVGSHRTRPIDLTVAPRPRDSGPSSGQDVFLEITVEPRNPYVQAQVLYSIRLYSAFPITEGAIQAPAPTGTVVERLGDDVSYDTQVGGRAFRVIERRFALFPERSGQILIPEVRFEGRIAAPGTGNRFNSLFSRGRSVSVQSDASTLEVRPQPPTYTGTTWLPAAAMTLAEVWPNGEPEFTVGEPVTRKLILRATGLMAPQLPSLEMPIPEGIKVYPDQPINQSRPEGTWMYGQREDNFALVPTVPGSVSLPAIRISWWNTSTDQQEELVVPEREFVVAGLPVSAADSKPVLIDPQTITDIAAPSVGAGQGRLWPILTGVATLFWLATLWLWLRARHGSRALAVAQETETPGLSAARRRLRSACATGDGERIARALLALARFIDAPHPITTLPGLAAHVNDGPLAEQFLALDRWLYYRGEPLWEAAVIAARSRKLKLASGSPPVPSKRGQSLPPLYPVTAQDLSVVN